MRKERLSGECDRLPGNARRCLPCLLFCRSTAISSCYSRAPSLTVQTYTHTPVLESNLNARTSLRSERDRTAPCVQSAQVPPLHTLFTSYLSQARTGGDRTCSSCSSCSATTTAAADSFHVREIETPVLLFLTLSEERDLSSGAKCTTTKKLSCFSQGMASKIDSWQKRIKKPVCNQRIVCWTASLPGVALPSHTRGRIVWGD